jgi:hypothetical protein
MRAPRPTRSSAAREPAPLAAGQAAVEQREFDIVDHAQVGDQVEALEHEAERAVAQLRHFLVAVRGDGRAADLHAALARPVEQADEIQQRALAAAAGAHHRDEFAAVDGEVDVLQCQRLDLVGAVGLAHFIQSDHGVPFVFNSKCGWCPGP